MENKQGSLFDQAPQASGDLPAASRMPLNARGRKVYDTLIRPAWSRYLDRGGRKAAITRLRDIHKSLLADPIPAQQLLDRVAGIATRQTWEERIVACILGYAGA